MSTPLLKTKLFIPHVRPELVSRPRLIKRLDESIRSAKLTLISASAGFGKTTLLSEWVTAGDRSVAWLSLGKEDDDLVSFLTYLVTALQTIDAGIGDDVLSVLQSPQVPPLKLLLTLLINDLALVSMEGDHKGHPYVLVLDDYHVIDAPSVHRSLEFLLDHLPPQLHLVILTREDPPLPLPRLRVRRQITHIRAQDLRFTIDEVTQFFQQTMGLRLSAQEVAALESRTEGWIAGLQMAALTMQDVEDTSAFIQTFTGDDRYVVDYLMTEVLSHQPPHIQTFLLQTSVLQRFNASLCDAVRSGSAGSPSSSEGTAVRFGKAKSPAEPHDGREILTQLERANLFVTPLDDRREGYRYHHLFADLLRYQLRAQEGEARVLDLHRRAARWFEQHGLVDDALFHYLAAKDTPAAASLVTTHAMLAFRRGEIHSAQKWLQTLPEEAIHTNPRLCLDMGWLCTVRDDYAQLVEFVAATKAALPGSDYENDHIFMGEWAALQAFAAFLLGETQTALTLGRRALDQLASQSAFVRGLINILLADIYTTTDIGEVSQAVACGQEAMTAGISSSSITISMYAADRLSRALVLQGEYQAAEVVSQQALELVRERGQAYAPILEILDLKYSGVLYELNRLAKAERLIRDGLSLSQRFGAPYSELWCRLLLRQAQLAQKIAADGVDPLATDEAIDALLLELSGQKSQHPAMVEFAAFRAQLWVIEKRLARAEQWAENTDLGLSDEPSCGKVFGYLALAHTHLALGGPLPELLTLLEKMDQLASRKGHVQQIIQIGLLQTLTLDKLDRFQAAQAVLEQCLALAEPTGMTRTFLDHGFPLIRLLRQTKHPYATKLLAVIEPGIVGGPAPIPGETTETLTEREIEVLRLFAAGLTNAAIARR
ncbi:MAG: AAA family ATPase, partial [Chloroflexi bacterium]|nr:AAA family ATPase [Chloroflexota bacterium]